MFGISQYVRILLVLCVGSTIFCVIFVTLPDHRGKKIDKEALTSQAEHRKQTQENFTILLRKRNFTAKQIGKTSLLGRWLLSSEGSLPPPVINKKKRPYLILIWKYGKFLERRHIKRFTNKKFSPWENCTVQKCVLSYRSKDLDVADAVVFHLHMTRSVLELPIRTQWNQKWIFLTDESPMHTFLFGNQELFKYNGLFNWSMTYRMNSDVPVPYGRTISRSFINSPNINFSKDLIKKIKTKLVTVMGSNCAGTNGRWDYVSELKLMLGHDLDIYGKCLNGHIDHYNGVTIDSNEEPCPAEEFADRLTASLQYWISNKKRTIWFRVFLSHSEWVPILVKEGFKFHHARQEYVMLYRWLVTSEECNVPHYAHTNLGVGGFVYNEETKEVLVIKEKYASQAARWKLPGGYVEPGENLEEAVKREVLEETGVQTSFKCIIGFRHTHDYAFGCSDIYMVAYLTPVDCGIKKCEKEISECKWMKVSDYLEHPEVHENNKLIVRKMLEFFKHRMGIAVQHELHSITNKPICIYTISKINAQHISNN